MKMGFLIFFFFYSVNLLYSQTGNEWPDFKGKEKEIQAFMETGQLDSVIVFCERIISSNNNSLSRGFAHYYLSKALGEQGYLKDQFQHLLKADSLFTKNEYRFGEMVASQDIAREHTFKGSYQQAIPYLETANQKAKQLLLNNYLFDILQSQSMLYTTLGDHNKAMSFLKEAIALAQELNITERIISIYNQIATNYYFSGQLDSASLYLNQLINYKRSNGVKEQIASDLSMLGRVYYELGKYVVATDTLISGLEEAELNKDTFLIMSFNTEIARIYAFQKIWGKAEEYANQAVKQANKKGIKLTEANNYALLGSIFAQQDSISIAFEYYQKAFKLYEQLNNSIKAAEVQLALAKLYGLKHDYERAVDFVNQALEVWKGQEELQGILNVQLVRSELEIEQGNAKKALPILENCLEMSGTLKNPEKKKDLYLLFSKAYAQTGDFKSAYRFHTRYSALNDSLLNIEKSKISEELIVSYDTRKKERTLYAQEIAIKSRDNRIGRQNIQLITLVIALVFLALFMVFLFSNAQKNRLLNLQKIEVLKKEKETQRLRSVVEGEEKERKRIARELHDGLGAFLATIKMRISALKHELPALESVGSYNKTEELIDEACQTVREISHNMVPGVLEQHGLKHALQTMCDNVSHSHKIDISFISFGLEQKLDPSIEVTVYRITQELIRNVVKHAEAKEVIVQLTVEDNQLNLIVEDDGKGFYVNHKKQTNGIGLDNISSRVKSLNGELNIDSTLNQGSTFTIDLPI